MKSDKIENIDSAEIVHIEGNLYHVPRNLISFSDNPDEDFVNPRHTMVFGQEEAKGLDPESIKALKESIRKNGLLNPPILQGRGNLGNSILKVNSGERRLRCIDLLIKENADCFDPNTRKFKPAAQLYSTIRCTIIVDIDLKEQYRLAYTTNDQSEGIGETADIMLVKKLHEKGLTNEEIMEITMKSSTWMRDTDLLLGLDEETLKAYVDGSINRTVAIKLAGIKNVEHRLTKLAELNKYRMLRNKILLEAVNQSLEQAIQERDLAEAELLDAQHIGDKKRKTLSEDRLKKAQEKIKRKSEEFQEITGKQITATRKDLDSIMPDGGERKLTASKIEKRWRPALISLIKNDGLDEDGNFVCDVEHASLVLYVVDHGLNQNEYDISTVLREFSQYNEKKAC